MIDIQHADPDYSKHTHIMYRNYQCLAILKEYCYFVSEGDHNFTYKLAYTWCEMFEIVACMAVLCKEIDVYHICCNSKFLLIFSLN